MTYNAGHYDVIVIGAGHAGVEAGLAAARMGAKTLMLTLNLDMIAFMPCNPSLGGPAKGIVVREIDALGGAMAKVIDKTHIQMRMLNTGKGPAVQALRAQADKPLYIKEMKNIIENEPNLTLRQGMVDELIVEDGVCKGVITETKAAYSAGTVIITTGTFMRGKVLMGDLEYESGPNNQRVSIKLSEHLEDLGFELTRFKTGTPPRVNSHTIDYSKTEIQPGDEKPQSFSYETTEYITDQIPCWLTYTNEFTHQVINDNLSLSAMYSGMKRGTGPRYCPSIEDKIVRFNDKPRHQIFLEPEGRDTEEVYVQGLSTSLPESIQHEMVRSVKGLENAEIMRAGYAIEYDAVVPTQLWPTLETKKIPGLFTAGQINGTSGYEEAAAQGIMAGINAAAKVQGKDPVILDRSQAYIGVLIDDLVTKGTNEPYRLLTSRAEYRLLLRHDNADLRLTEVGHKLGIISEERYAKFLEKKRLVEEEKKRLNKIVIKPNEDVNNIITNAGGTPLKEAFKAYDLMKRPELSYELVDQMLPEHANLPVDVQEQVGIQIKYEGYINKAKEQVARMLKMEDKKIPEDIDYDAISGIATEAREKLKKVRPLSVGQASRISGVNPADVSILLVYIEQGNIARVAN
ncbi:tRNA uridine-5-carboxymethylaminomethyl(34) synthesis enzyme MnmG [Virgibacillus halodenitrificans]|uniref:tRNA uridine 5-carboxymethylaminomethyl modification enzyme MnmG n=1 Tax=Virgibacillus halodenitrificans TaxID=1482 RepID=A0ABR7VK57_VIRHA|nr:tRNA uridine-5-carboxymethylaminomethyl(34) synthesis enzyme MnmG [Virgibacillus halodenitrificans]MBD1222310.1 tRNA uridine-5-carboxymethylaminomethyl(34) synthesis enzyme MnmG [Virgibacillus halodenitrificans]MCG1027558.1 tRNA uridine-5-carboxymethylaminomethyl(34) synthesis enzyme MnmG [Virgibacillus halodenitrificans]MEC2157604.1 tRNA uridine-5-carboxymethylaminomethyl(34) synthesis enzyme MnmG [Virgibacillus halodenitrificans]MYL44440.1 tRNA uridine-5-carboxymethylaminomethyl(34) synthe